MDYVCSNEILSWWFGSCCFSLSSAMIRIRMNDRLDWLLVDSRPKPVQFNLIFPLCYHVFLRLILPKFHKFLTFRSIFFPVSVNRKKSNIFVRGQICFHLTFFLLANKIFILKRRFIEKFVCYFLKTKLKILIRLEIKLKKLNIFVIGLYNFLLGQFSDLQLRSLFTYWVTPLRSLFPIKIYFQSNDKEFW